MNQSLPSSAVSQPSVPRPGTARAEAPVMFSRQTYRRITLGISVAFALLVLPAAAVQRQHTTIWELLLLFINAVLYFQVQFWVNYLLRYVNNPVQRWLSNQPLWVDRLLRAVIIAIMFTLYIVARNYVDSFLGINMETTSLRIRVILSQILTAVGLSFQLAIELVESGRYLTIENESLKREQLQARYESLKQQLSPHFLFNSLSTLGELIYDEPAAAALFVEEMAQVYRYLLRYGEQMAVPLRDEVSFLRSYFYLLQMRFGDGIKLEMDLPAEVLDRQVPPLALQLLMENAVKHNTVSRRQPLLVRVDFVAPATLRVRNTRVPRLVPEPSSGIGLSNLTNRVRMLNQQSLLVEQTDDEFSVYIPLPA
ncbi:sensor histidine kinase [Hymenobacter monticola]|uniref:Histidine kinase n=1 Tax=Hymenobacter monticola TaxID=1705399 RepID=A0ABY4BB76_9BACT|nr:histidine kinase [Hymenobacter monticola]UOE36413.1 histidine kinase [Hymenobacter monticola]